MTDSRIVGIDIIKISAIFFVIAGHFFVLHTPFMATPFEGVAMFMQGTAYELFAIGVPLFIISSGYLNGHKTISRKYYRGIWKVIISYIFFSILTIVFKKFYLQEPISLLGAIDGILRFNTIPYGWYIEMWIGLYLLTPFINKLYFAIEDQKGKQLLIVIMAFITLLPKTFNRYGLHILPDFWLTLWPLTYFIAGLYIKEYDCKIKPIIGWPLLILFCLSEPILNVFLFNGQDFVFLLGDLSIAAIAILFFILVKDYHMSSSSASRICQKVASLTLDVYLVCFVFDMLYYPWFKDRFFIDQSQFGIYFFILVPLVFFSSLLVAWLKDGLFKLCRVDNI